EGGRAIGRAPRRLDGLEPGPRLEEVVGELGEIDGLAEGDAALEGARDPLVELALLLDRAVDDVARLRVLDLDARVAAAREALAGELVDRRQRVAHPDSQRPRDEGRAGRPVERGQDLERAARDRREPRGAPPDHDADAVRDLEGEGVLLREVPEAAPPVE